MQKVTDSGGRGTSNAKGFYRYTPAQAKRWETYSGNSASRIRDLAKDYPRRCGRSVVVETPSAPLNVILAPQERRDQILLARACHPAELELK